jgi:hypothetical protein
MSYTITGLTGSTGNSAIGYHIGYLGGNANVMYKTTEEQLREVKKELETTEHELITTKKRLDDLENKMRMLWYAPGMPGSVCAQSDFQGALEKIAAE